MALFGGKFKSLNLMDDIAPVNGVDAQVATPVSMAPGIRQAPKGLFQEGTNSLKALDFILGGYEGLDRRERMGKADEADVARKQAYEALGGAPEITPQLILQAQRAGVDVGPLADFMKSQQPMKPQYERVGDSIVQITPDGRANPIYSAPQEQQQPRIIQGPYGIYQVNPDGTVKDLKSWTPTAIATKSMGGPPRKGGGTNAEPPE